MGYLVCILTYTTTTSMTHPGIPSTTTTTTTTITTYPVKPPEGASVEEINDAFKKLSELQSEAIQDQVLARECIMISEPKQETDVADQMVPPPIDVFLNPERKSELENISNSIKTMSRNFFSKSSMDELYPELFRVLWESSLPCLPAPGAGGAMLQACSLAGIPLPCGDIFTRIPTDSGMRLLILTNSFLCLTKSCPLFILY